MPPRRGTKAYKEETIKVIYGINPRTKRVQTVDQRRDGCLSTWGDDERYIVHPIKPGWTGEREAALVFGLREVFSVPVALHDADSTKRKLEELQTKAAAWDDEAWLKGD